MTTLAPDWPQPERGSSSGGREVPRLTPAPNLVESLTTAAGQLVVSARAEADRLDRTLALLDEKVERLAEEGIIVNFNLGPIGNAAAEARRKEAAR